MSEGYTVAIVGATGLVGAEIGAALAERCFPLERLLLFASERTAGEKVGVGGRQVTVDLLDRADFQGVAVAFFAATEAVSAEWVGRATAAGAVVIDLTQLYADDPAVPLIVPETNAAAVAEYAARGVIAGPGPAALQLAVVLKPLRDAAGLKRVIVSSYEPVSEVGRAGIEELSKQTVELLNGRTPEVEVFPHRIAFSLVPQVGEFLAGGYTRSEHQLMAQTRRLLGDPDLPITATSVRLPLFYGLSQSVNVETHESLDVDTAREALRSAPGILLQDDPMTGEYPTPISTVGSDGTCVGRIRADDSVANGLNLWISGDNVRWGAAVNAVAIAEILIRDYI